MRAGSRLGRMVVVGACVAPCIMVIACEPVTVPSLNAPISEEIMRSPDANTANAAARGLLVLARIATPTYALRLGVLGREIVVLDASETRNVSEMLAEPLTPGGIFIDMGWSLTYAQVRNCLTLLALLDRVPDYTESQKEAMRGLTKTFLAMAYIDQLRVRDTFGIVLDVSLEGSTVGDFVSRDSAYVRAAQLLDEAKGHLLAEGAAFPFALPSGFTGFSTPATFLRFNRAIAARMEVYRQRWAAAVVALGESFISTTSGARGALDAGVYNVYAAGQGNHGLAGQTRLVVPTFLAEAQLRADGSPDLRAAAKAQATSTTVTVQGVSSNVRQTVYANNFSRLPIIKNEELILLRAEANLALGNTAAAIADLNFIRVNSGGLAPLPSGFAGDLVGEVLYNRRYSLFYEYGHRWLDMRRYGRLAQLPKMLPSHRIFPIVPLPSAECNARDPQPSGCVQVDGF